MIWATKNHIRIFDKNTSQKLTQHILNKAGDFKVPFISLNIQPEHVHGLINLPSDISVANFMQIIKGGSSHWLNQELKQSRSLTFKVSSHSSSNV